MENYEIAKDAIEDAIENRKLAGQPKDKGLEEALKIIKKSSEPSLDLRGVGYPMRIDDLMIKWHKVMKKKNG